MPLRLKVEINTREHFALQGFTAAPFSVSSRWFNGTAEIVTYQLDELLGTKMRALYQRRKGRDLFDLAIALKLEIANPARIVETFSGYMANEGKRVTRATFEQNLSDKLDNRQFTADIGPLLASGYRWSLQEASEAVSTGLVALLPGEPWSAGKGPADAMA